MKNIDEYLAAVMVLAAASPPVSFCSAIAQKVGEWGHFLPGRCQVTLIISSDWFLMPHLLKQCTPHIPEELSWQVSQNYPPRPSPTPLDLNTHYFLGSIYA